MPSFKVSQDNPSAEHAMVFCNPSATPTYAKTGFVGFSRHPFRHRSDSLPQPRRPRGAVGDGRASWPVRPVRCGRSQAGAARSRLEDGSSRFREDSPPGRSGGTQVLPADSGEHLSKKSAGWVTNAALRCMSSRSHQTECILLAQPIFA